MLRHIRIATETLLWLLAFTLPAFAEPVSTAIAAFTVAAKTFAATTIGKIVISLALTVGSTLIQRWAASKNKPQEAGVRGAVQIGGDNPLSFIAGTFATMGQLEYANTYGVAAVTKTPNAFYTQVVSLADLPVIGLAGIHVNGQPCTLLTAEPHDTLGWPVQQYRVGDVDHLWVKFYDGSQTTADARMLFDFGSDPDRPWTSDMVGAGLPYAIVTARINRNLFTGFPQVKFVIIGTRFYDLRKDSTVGGSGSQRWNDPDTWDGSGYDNPVVIIYNILRGIRFDGEWLYGLQNLPAARLPAANWMAAMNACDQEISLAGGGTEKQYRCGLEITTNRQPVDVIEDLLKACAGRMAEIGGVYKIRCGTPGAAVYAFTDADCVITQGQSFDPFPGLESTTNGMHAKYPEPLEGWTAKDAPPRYNADYEADDDDQRLIADVTFNAVPYPLQVQRLMTAAIEEARRFRRHSHTMPPEAWLLEPLDTVAWSSARNGYSNKLFDIAAMDDLDNCNQVPVLQEIDPADYDWSSDMELPVSTGFLGRTLPPAQILSGWAVEPATLENATGTSARPSIRVFYDGDADDVKEVHIQVKLDGAPDDELVFDGTLPYGKPIPDSLKSVILNGVFAPVEDYEVRGILVPYSGRDVEWSDWLPVTTPEALISSFDIYDDAIIAAKIADAAIEASHIMAGAVTEIKIAALAVSTAKLQVAAVTEAVLASNAVVASKIAALAVTEAKVAANAITVNKIANDAVEESKLATGAVSAAKIAAGAIVAGKIAAGAIVAADIAADTITASKIAAGAIETSELAAGAVTTAKVAAGAITANEIAALTITAAKIAAGTITGDKIQAATIVGSLIAASTISGDRLVANSITARELVLTDWTNLIPDPYFADANAWSVSQFAWQSAAANGYNGNDTYFYRNGTSQPPGQIVGQYFSVQPGDEFMVATAIRRFTGTGSFRSMLLVYNGAGAQIGALGLNTWTTGDPTSWVQKTGYATIPANAVRARYFVDTAGAATSGTWQIGFAGVYRRANAELIVDGAISAAKIQANSITGGMIQAGAITAAKISAGTITADRLVLNGITFDRIGHNQILNVAYMSSSVVTYGYGPGQTVPTIGAWVQVASQTLGQCSAGWLDGTCGLSAATGGSGTAVGQWRLRRLPDGATIASGNVNTSGTTSSQYQYASPVLGAYYDDSYGYVMEVYATSITGNGHINVLCGMSFLWGRR